MRITDDMVQRFFDGATTDPGETIVAKEVRCGLEEVAPMIAEAAAAGFIEQGHQLRRAVSLLRSVVDPHRSHTVFPEIDAFLSQVDL